LFYKQQRPCFLEQTGGARRIIPCFRAFAV